MKSKTESTSRNLARSMAMGVLLSMLIFYSIHVMGKWDVENYQRDSQTTSTVLLHNTCAIIGASHTLRPNTDVSALGGGIDGTKLSGSFMNFTNGHVPGMVMLAILLGGLVYVIRSRMQKNWQARTAL